MATYNQIHRYGTQAQYDALDTPNSNYLYFTSDTHKLYKGTIDYTNNLIEVSAVPNTGVAGKIYFETSTGQVKAYIGEEWEVISYPISQAIDEDNASSVAVPSEAAVVNYVESVVGDQPVVTDIDQKMNGSTAVAGTLVATKADASTFDIHMAGLAVNPTWNSETRQLTIPVTKTDGTTENVVANIGKDIFLDPGEGKNYFDPDTKEIVLTLNDGTSTTDPTVIRIPASALYNDYIGEETNTAEVSIDDTTHEITTVVKLDTAAGNAITVVTGEGGGLRVDLSAYATTASVDGIRENLQGQIDTVSGKVNAATASIADIETTLNATTAKLDTVEGTLNATTETLDDLVDNYNATTLELSTLKTNYNATTNTLNNLVDNYNNTTTTLNDVKNTVSAATNTLNNLVDDYNATTLELSTLKTNYNATTNTLNNLIDDYNNTTADLVAVETKLNNTTNTLDNLESNYNATTLELSTLKTNYNSTTQTLDNLVSNYNATTVQVADNTTNIANLATAATSWAGFSD